MRVVLALALVIASCGTKESAAPATTGSAARGSGSGSGSGGEDPFAAKTWIPKLKDPRMSERAVSVLEQIGDPAAIQPLADAWVKLGRPARVVELVIALARPLTPEQAKQGYFVTYETEGRPASIAKLPCPQCITKLDAAINAGEGKSSLAAVNTETTILRNYFASVGRP